MSKRAALFVVWAGIGFVFSMKWLYLFTPIGPAGLALVLPLVWVLEGHGLNKQPEIWGLLAGPGLFFLLVATSVRPGAWAAAGCGAVMVASVGFAVSGRARCARQV